MKGFWLGITITLVALFSLCCGLKGQNERQRYQQRELDIAGTKIRNDETPEMALKRAAHMYGYLVLGEGGGHETIAISDMTLPAKKLDEWKKFSRERMHMRVSDLPGDIFRASISFDDSGEEVRGVDIIWFGETHTVGFPYHLSREETLVFVKSAIKDMARLDKIRENRK